MAAERKKTTSRQSAAGRQRNLAKEARWSVELEIDKTVRVSEAELLVLETYLGRNWMRCSGGVPLTPQWLCRARGDGEFESPKTGMTASCHPNPRPVFDAPQACRSSSGTPCVPTASAKPMRARRVNRQSPRNAGREPQGPAPARAGWAQRAIDAAEHHGISLQIPTEIRKIRNLLARPYPPRQRHPHWPKSANPLERGSARASASPSSCSIPACPT